ncbi:uncharacterized protein B0H64DRAFT_392468 [Chaetomium fimeti]|uniref:Uncharacterized protein n=1 Tax=Chaetomium fimeti TaxID=1854472 RepID=A0AAE0LTU6_9PEZI|nr:hypothetical protein B0H64DRAFT_392468 [Chaetomium fimeti]
MPPQGTARPAQASGPAKTNSTPATTKANSTPPTTKTTSTPATTKANQTPATTKANSTPATTKPNSTPAAASSSTSNASSTPAKAPTPEDAKFNAEQSRKDAIMQAHWRQWSASADTDLTYVIIFDQSSAPVTAEIKRIAGPGVKPAAVPRVRGLIEIIQGAKLGNVQAATVSAAVYSEIKEKFDLKPMTVKMGKDQRTGFVPSARASTGAGTPGQQASGNSNAAKTGNAGSGSATKGGNGAGASTGAGNAAKGTGGAGASTATKTGNAAASTATKGGSAGGASTKTTNSGGAGGAVKGKGQERS